MNALKKLWLATAAALALVVLLTLSFSLSTRSTATASVAQAASLAAPVAAPFADVSAQVTETTEMTETDAATSAASGEFVDEAMTDETFTGVVYEDLNGDQVRDADEPGIAGVRVSNGMQIVETDEDGSYELPVRTNSVFFVIKPADYMVPVDENNVPRFYYIHYPDGSPEYIQEFRGIEPTGEIPESVDFALYAIEEGSEMADNAFTQLAIGDTQPTNHDELRYVRDDVIADIVQHDAFGAEIAIALGDLMNDNLTMYGRYQEIMGESGVPTFYIPGNHDMDVDAIDDEHHLDTYISWFGPTYYSFDHGDVHFVGLDNVLWLGATEDFRTGNYTGTITMEQMEWLANDLETVPEDKLIVLALHIPLVSWIDADAPKHMTHNRDALYALLEDRNVLAMAGHTHTTEVHVAGDEMDQWNGEMPFTHIIAGAAAGSWWSGEEDARGIPIAYQREGAPNGYFVIDYEGSEFQPFYKGAGMDPDQQMHAAFAIRRGSTLPPNTMTVDELGASELVVNVWAGSTASTVTCEYSNGESFEGTHSTTTPDPLALDRQEGLREGLLTEASWHIWTCPVSETLEPGMNHVNITTNDAFGQTFDHTLLFEVWDVQ